ncbi:DUF221-domain-containing protein [Punctularia strigosozonata HHB-11173 SS5]|uniref:DUF221-domain-containing protein n=1 Tax=Punctularia strigosozonata (strain HHB-11173) TaxID=741275 RepID=UPI0004416A70|nr:DUF221-domain-containing protein [Punctularia strigosozonata HHB-11173 SS5]EIN08427.1 DUF221-domain-containing protein [Punctularia strigosozonata HHB-11173 SS5]
MSDLSGATTKSTSSFVTSIIFNSIVFGGELAAFTLFRPYFHLIYEPRAYSPVSSKRVDPLTPSAPIASLADWRGNLNNWKANWLKWPIRLWGADYTRIKGVNGMDAYMFVRFLRMLIRMWLPIWLLSWIVLLPVTSVNTNVSGHDGLDIFIFGNVSPEKQVRYWAHLIMAWAFTFWMWWNIRYEMRHFVSSRQHHLIEPSHSSSAQANTVLITGIPKKYLTESALSQLYSVLPGGVQKVWLNRDLKDMPQLYDDQVAACKVLESAETSLIKTAVKRQAKEAKEAAKKKGTAPGRVSEDAHPLTKAHHTHTNVDLAEKLVPRADRPTHRLKAKGFEWLPFSLPFMGEKVDSIDWARQELARTSMGLKRARRDYRADVQSADDSTNDTYPPLNSAFVLFNKQIAAHLAAQSLAHHEPYRMANKYTEVAPADVIWSNLGLNPYEQRLRWLISFGCTVGLVILWAFPVAFVGALSNIHSLATTYSWLAWLDDLGPTVIGIIQGILPSVLLAVLMMLLPIVLRLLARFEGIPTRSGLELSLMNRYFGFQVIHSFLIVTLSSGLIAALPDLIKSPESIPTLLAQKLPQASTFFLTYTILQGLSGTAGGFLQVVTLVLYYVKLFLLGSTPRSVFKIKYGARTTNLGTTFPGVTLLMVIATAYMVISPIINGLAWASFALFYFLYKYLFLWVNRTPKSSDTGGLFFPKAIQHMFVGMYLQHVCLAALFFLARNEKNKASSIPQGALMIVLIGLTFIFHMMINNSYGPLIHDLPLTLADKTHGLRQDSQAHEAKTTSSPDPDAEDAPRRRRRSRPLSRMLDLVEPERAGSSAQDVEGNPGKAKAFPAEQPNEAEMVYPPSPPTSNEPSTPGLKRRKSGGSVASASTGHTMDSQGTSSSVREEFAAAEQGGEGEEDEDVGPTDFNHPATAAEPPVIWIPKDDLGLGDYEAAASKKRGIEATTEGAHMDSKGHVEISTAPPDDRELNES